MTSVLRKPRQADWRQWVDGLHESLARARQLARRGSARREDLEALMRSFHLIKGYAQALGFHGVEGVAHGLEARLVAWLAQPEEVAQPDGVRSLLSFKGLMTEGLRKLDAEIGKLREQELTGAVAAEEGGPRPLASLLAAVGSLARSLAAEVGRQIEFEFACAGELMMPKEWEAPLEAALLHAARNSVDHGGEAAPGPLRISFAAAREGSEVRIECRDSGRGIDPERVRELARARQPRFDAEMGGLPDDEILQLLFLPGFSLSPGVSKLSGRGYGLNIVREAVESRLRGSARIESRPGLGTKLVLRIPV